MPSQDRRAAARRRAWGRGPTILRFEPLEGRELLSTAVAASTTSMAPTSAPAATASTSAARPDLVATSFNTVHNLDWGGTFQAAGTVQNQGAAAATSPFQVDVYAAPANDAADLTADPDAVKLGSIAVPGGLAAGASASFNQALRLPATPVPGFDPGAGLKVALVVDPTDAAGEAQGTDKQGLGPGVDQSAVVITPGATSPAAGLLSGLGGQAASPTTGLDAPAVPQQAQPPKLVGTGFAVASSSILTWGGTLDVQAQVTDNSNTDAPATRARIVLTPAGATPGGASDVTIGNLAIPALPNGQTASVSGSIPLPSAPTAALAGGSTFTVSMIPDADYQADPVGPHQATQGAGLDQATIQMAVAATASTAPRPDLVPAPVQAPAALNWGQTFQVTTAVLNTGPAAAGPVRVRFWLADASGTTTNSLFLGDTVVSSIKSQFAQPLTQTLTLPAAPPANLQLTAGGTGQILVQVDPENMIDELSKANNLANSPPITLKLVTADGTSVVPVRSTALGTPQPIVNAAAPAPPKPAGSTKSTPTTSTVTTSTAHETARQAALQQRAEARAAARQRLINLRLNVAAKHLRVFPKAAGKA